MKENNLPFPVSSIELEKVYQVMDKRDSLKWNTRVLSWLLGFRPLYVRDIENPNRTLRYTPKDTNYMLSIFRCNLSELMFARISDLYYQIKVIEIENKDQTITYEIYRESADKKLVIFRKFTTEPDLKSLASVKAKEDKNVSQFIDHLFESSYFKAPKTALEVFNHCRDKFGDQLHPEFVMNSMKDYTSRKKSPKLIKKKNESGRYTYRKG